MLDNDKDKDLGVTDTSPVPVLGEFELDTSGNAPRSNPHR
jgi:hypothetical protein